MTGRRQYNQLSEYHIPGYSDDAVSRIPDDTISDTSVEEKMIQLPGELVGSHGDVLAIDANLDAIRSDTLRAA